MMTRLLSTRLLALATALAAALTATFLVAAAHAGASQNSGALVTLHNTALGSVLADAHGRTLYLFEKDRNGMSKCTTACLTYWPALTSRGTPRAGSGVHQSLLQLGPARHGAQQVLYAGHPLYTFTGDKRSGQTAGENLNTFGAEWYALSASGAKVEPVKSPSTGTGGGY